MAPDMPGYQIGRALLAATVAQVAAGGAAAPAPPPPDARVVEIVARRFAFEPDRVEVQQGERVRLVVRSADGVHGVGIKAFKVNAPVPRGGAPVTIEFVADRAGTFEILCSEYCGPGHGGMKGVLVVHATPPPAPRHP